MPTRIGGSFAPPLDDGTLDTYLTLANMAEPEVKDALIKLHTCVTKWWNLPESSGKGEPHPSGRGEIVVLDDPIQKDLYDSIPWTKELKYYGELFESLTGDLRHAAFHLLWHVNELNLDREPITTDKIK